MNQSNAIWLSRNSRELQGLPFDEPVTHTFLFSDVSDELDWSTFCTLTDRGLIKSEGLTDGQCERDRNRWTISQKLHDYVHERSKYTHLT